MKRNETETPPEFLPAKTRPEKPSLNGFTKDTTLLSHIPKKRKPVILVISMHNNDLGKTKISKFYNFTKSDVGEIEKKVHSVYASLHTHTPSRRWPMTIFHRIFDINSVNSHRSHDVHVGRQTHRGTCIKNSSTAGIRKYKAKIL